MSVGEWLGRWGLPYVVTTPGGPAAGRALPGIRPVPAPDLACALALAEAEATMGAGLAALWDGEVLTLLSRRVDAGEPVTARSADELADVARSARESGAGAVAVRLGFDPAAAGPGSGPGAGLASPGRAGHEDPSLAPRLTGRPWLPGDGGITEADLVLAGRGVVRADATAALQRFAATTGLGVLNTFAAKGVFHWASPYHLGTGCLQERDLALAGAHPDALVVTVGLDADECAPALFSAAGLDPARTLTVEVTDLPAAAESLRARVPVVEGGERPALYRELFAVVQPLYARTGAPLNPACAAADLAAVLGEAGDVWTEPGPAAHWIARTFSTVRLGSVRVPAAGRAGTAIAGALSAGLRGAGAAVAVVDRPPTSGVAADCLAWAEKLGVSLVVEVWGERGAPLSSAEHRERLAGALVTLGVSVLELPVDYAALGSLTAAAGPVIAWKSGRSPEGTGHGSE
ncbi:thiamine pyrophosphate-binding protein [Frankia sp. CNm7]|nr:thiamine pyrophosphate-binding protein [Frankia nepalensis]